ncbi:hypothetical protein ACCUM_1917 [Candidatus Accumulibacter phosphatis]|uniref:Uncharacterized protein n=1 Tax=Candidatus Accumulibacter phosphatis TaxID=327160 RepID=A0A5S4EIL9_9PROT|nr:hypothetical protein ACCUM_1917 [Candidatus Accumulibacter phosphatis]
MVDIVGAETSAYQFLEQVGFLVAALGRTKTGKCAATVLLANRPQPGRRPLQCLFPARFPKMRAGPGRVEGRVGDLGRVIAANQGFQQALWRVHIVETEAPLDAQALAIGRPVAAADGEDPIIADLIVDLAADATVRTDAGNDAVDGLACPEQAAAVIGKHRGRQQCAGRAGLHAFAAADTARSAHRVVEIENDPRRCAATSHADHVVCLDVAASLQTELAVDAGIELHAHRRVAAVGTGRPGALRKAAGVHTRLPGPVPERRVAVVRLRAWRLFGEQQFDHHPSALPGTFGSVATHLHPLADLAAATGGEISLAVDLDHAGAAVAARLIVWRCARTQMRNRRTGAPGCLPDGFAGQRRQRAAIENEAKLC